MQYHNNHNFYELSKSENIQNGPVGFFHRDHLSLATYAALPRQNNQCMVSTYMIVASVDVVAHVIFFRLA